MGIISKITYNYMIMFSPERLMKTMDTLNKKKIKKNKLDTKFGINQEFRNPLMTMIPPD